MVKKNKKCEPSSNNNKNPPTKRKRKQRTKTNSRKTKTKKDGTDHHNINENINDFEYVNKNVTVKKIMEDNINILNLQSNNNKKDEKDESNKKKAIIRTKAFAVDTNVQDGIIISSPFLIPIKIAAISKEAVHE